MSEKILPVPDLATSVAAVFRLNFKRMLRGRKLRFALVALVLVVGATLTARYVVDPDDPQLLVRDAIRTGFFGLLAYLLPFLFNSGAIAEEVETRTLPYLLLRPRAASGSRSASTSRAPRSRSRCSRRVCSCSTWARTRPSRAR